MAPQEVSQNLSQAFAGPTGTFPEVDCTASATACSAIPGQLPPSAQITCDAAPTAGKQHCVLHYDITVHQTINLSQEASFPTAVTSSPVVNLVTINRVGYWAGPSQKLNVATPPLDLYVGSSTATTATDPGVEQLGTIASIPAGAAPSAAPDCTAGPATSAANACDLQLSPAGTALFSTLAKTYTTPFNIIVVGHLSLTGGEPFPAGALDLFLQPVLGFQL
jgi:hypothetical protein